jgi:hypothetical protein
MPAGSKRKCEQTARDSSAAQAAVSSARQGSCSGRMQPRDPPPTAVSLRSARHQAAAGPYPRDRRCKSHLTNASLPCFSLWLSAKVVVRGGQFNSIQVEWPGESHPPAVADPGVSLSTHRALVIQPKTARVPTSGRTAWPRVVGRSLVTAVLVASRGGVACISWWPIGRGIRRCVGGARSAWTGRSGRSS